MSDGIYSALSGAVSQARTLDVVANNVANANTTGFRADRVSFQEEVARSAAGAQNPEELRFVAIAEVQMDQTAGAFKQTGNVLDLAIEGDGWFSVDAPQGERFTRAGSFSTSSDGMLVTKDGFPVLAEGQPRTITIPEGTQNVIVQRDGTVTADEQTVGRLRLRRFEPDEIEKEGSTMVRATGPGVEAQVEVMQGFLEMSNMNAVAGLNDMIQASRAYEAFQKVIRSYRTIDERAARELGRGR